MRVPSCGDGEIAEESVLLSLFICCRYDPVARSPTTRISSVVRLKRGGDGPLEPPCVSRVLFSSASFFPKGNGLRLALDGTEHVTREEVVGFRVFD